MSSSSTVNKEIDETEPYWMPRNPDGTIMYKLNIVSYYKGPKQDDVVKPSFSHHHHDNDVKMMEISSQFNTDDDDKMMETSSQYNHDDDDKTVAYEEKGEEEEEIDKRDVMNVKNKSHNIQSKNDVDPKVEKLTFKKLASKVQQHDSTHPMTKPNQIYGRPELVHSYKPMSDTFWERENPMIFIDFDGKSYTMTFESGENQIGVIKKNKSSLHFKDNLIFLPRFLEHRDRPTNEEIIQYQIDSEKGFILKPLKGRFTKYENDQYMKQGGRCSLTNLILSLDKLSPFRMTRSDYDGSLICLFRYKQYLSL
jgi:hypothetical protein